MVHHSYIIFSAVTVSSRVPPIQNVTLNEKDTHIYCDFLGYPIPSLTWSFNERLVDSTVFTTWHEQVIGENNEEITRAFLRFVPHSILFNGAYKCTAQQNEFQAAHCIVTTNIQGRYIISPDHSSACYTSLCPCASFI